MTKRHNCTKYISTRTDKVICMDKSDKLNHTDKITIDKMDYVCCEADYYGPKAPTQIIINKHLCNIKWYECLGEYSINQDKICLFNDGFDYWYEINKTPIEEQVARTLSHEIMHRILFYDHGEDECRAFDNIAEGLRQYWMW